STLGVPRITAVTFFGVAAGWAAAGAVARAGGPLWQPAATRKSTRSGPHARTRLGTNEQSKRQRGDTLRPSILSRANVGRVWSDVIQGSRSRAVQAERGSTTTAG